MRRHRAGKDLTKEVQTAPHGKKVLEREKIKLIGKIVWPKEIALTKKSIKRNELYSKNTYDRVFWIT